MLSRRRYALIALIAAFALIVAACGDDDDSGGDGDGGLICQVTDTGGVDDKSFNASAWVGAQRAATDFGAEAKVVESQAETVPHPDRPARAPGPVARAPDDETGPPAPSQETPDPPPVALAGASES